MTKGKKILTHAILILASFLSVFPLYYMLCGATNPSIDVIRGKLIPGTYLVENFKALVANQNLALAMTNSFRNAILMTLITLLVCSIAGYGFEIYHDKAKDILMSVLLLAMMLPFVAIMIPLFKMISGWGLVNSWAAFVLPSISTPFMIMLFRQAARSFPNDIIEAARLEGLSEIGIFFRMFIPIMRSTYGAAMTVTFMNAWNSYLWPKIVFQNNSSITMPMLVANLKSGYSVDYGMLMLGVLICTLPTAIICLTLAKRWGLIEDDTPAALEARRAAKNAAAARCKADGTTVYGVRHYSAPAYLQYELTRFKLDFVEPCGKIRALGVCPDFTEAQTRAWYDANRDLFTRYFGDSFSYEESRQIIEKRMREEVYDNLVQDILCEPADRQGRE